MEDPEERFVTLTSGCRICYQTFGKPSDSAILLIQGWGTSMTQNAGELARFLSTHEAPHFVIRYDHRDTGRSSLFTRPPDGSDVYSMEDMAQDAVGLARHLKLKNLHLVGSSLGGPISWLAAEQLSDIVRSLALILTSPVGAVQNDADGLPPLKSESRELLAAAFELPDDLQNDRQWIERSVKLELALATQPPTADEIAESRRNSEKTYAREKESGTLWTKSNHSDVARVRWPRERLKKIRCPTVVVHAAKDQTFPQEHAEALAGDIDGATLVILDNCGHEMPQRIRRPLAKIILANVAKGDQT